MGKTNQNQGGRNPRGAKCECIYDDKGLCDHCGLRKKRQFLGGYGVWQHYAIRPPWYKCKRYQDLSSAEKKAVDAAITTILFDR